MSARKGGPGKDKLTAIDGFDISGYSRAIARDFWESQRFDVTNNFIHDNTCADQSIAGARIALVMSRARSKATRG
jgi:hypothetical protein